MAGEQSHICNEPIELGLTEVSEPVVGGERLSAEKQALQLGNSGGQPSCEKSSGEAAETGEKRVGSSQFDVSAVDSLGHSGNQHITNDLEMSGKGQSGVSGITTRRRAAAVAANIKPDTPNSDVGKASESLPEAGEDAGNIAEKVVGEQQEEGEQVEGGEDGGVVQEDNRELAEDGIAPGLSEGEKLSTSEEDNAVPATASAGEGDVGDGAAGTSSGTVIPVKRKGLSGLKARLAKPKARRLDSDVDLVTAAVVAQAQVAAAAAQQAELYRRNPAEDANRGEAPAATAELAPAEVATGTSPSSSAAPIAVAEGIDGANTIALDTDSNANANEARLGEDASLTASHSERGRGRGRARGRGRGRGRGRKPLASPSGEGATGGRATGPGSRGRRGVRGGRARGRGRAASLASLARDESVEVAGGVDVEGDNELPEDNAALHTSPEGEDVGPESSAGPSERANPVDYGKQPVSAGNDADMETDKHGRKSYVITKQRESWSAEEHERFMEGVEKYGRKWKEVAEHVNTRTPVQIRSHAQKYFIKLTKTGIQADIPPPRFKKKARDRGASNHAGGVSESSTHDNPEGVDASDEDTSGTAVPISNESMKLLEAAQQMHAQQMGGEEDGNGSDMPLQGMPFTDCNAVENMGMEGFEMGSSREESKRTYSMMMQNESPMMGGGMQMPVSQAIPPPGGGQECMPSNQTRQSPMAQQSPMILPQQRQSPMDQPLHAPRQSPMISPSSQQKPSTQEVSPMMSQQCQMQAIAGMGGRQQQQQMMEGRSMQQAFGVDGNQPCSQWPFSEHQGTDPSMGMQQRTMAPYGQGGMPEVNGSWNGRMNPSVGMDELGSVLHQAGNLHGGRGMGRAMYLDPDMSYQGDMGGGGSMCMQGPPGSSWVQDGSQSSRDAGYGYGNGGEGPHRSHFMEPGIEGGDYSRYMRGVTMGGIPPGMMSRDSQMFGAGPRPGEGRPMMPGMGTGSDFAEGLGFDQMMQGRASDTGLPRNMPMGMPQQMQNMTRQGQFGQYGMRQIPQEMEDMYAQQQANMMSGRDGYGSRPAPGSGGSVDMYDTTTAAASGMGSWQQWGDGCGIQRKMMPGGGVGPSSGIPGGPGPQGITQSSMMDPQMMGYGDGSGGYVGDQMQDWGEMPQGMPSQWGNQPSGYGIAPNMRR